MEEKDWGTLLDTLKRKGKEEEKEVSMISLFITILMNNFLINCSSMQYAGRVFKRGLNIYI